MTVRLISYTQIGEILALENGGDMDITDQIAYVARVSNPSNQLAQDRDDTRLINYLIRNKHWSPFEMCDICLEITSSRAIVRQILRHRSFSFQEFSQRYASVDADAEMIESEVRLQDKKNRQNSLEVSDDELKEWWAQKVRDHYKNTLSLYNAAQDQGVAKEVARAVLPEGLTPSTIYMKGSVRSWIHYIQLRTCKYWCPVKKEWIFGTQKEHKEIALECAKVIEPVFPQIMNFTENEDGKSN